MDLITHYLSSFDPQNPNFRPTEIYNENWLLKLVLNQAAAHEGGRFPLAFNAGSTWFSEAQLPTIFKARYRGDPLAEARTNADGVIGHIVIGKHGKADLTLKPHVAQLTVIEAKIWSPLSAGTRNAPYFNQAARNVACIAEVFHRANVKPFDVERVEFVLLAPQSTMDQGKFDTQLRLENIRSVVKQRVFEYGGQLDHWHSEWFEPTASKIQIRAISWEKTIEWLSDFNSIVGNSLREFYRLSLEFN